MRTCKLDWCNGKHHSKGYCQKHYTQIKRRGHIFRYGRKEPNKVVFEEDVAKISLYDKWLNEIAQAVIDKGDYDKVKEFRWFLSKSGNYVATISKETNRLVYLHNVIFGRKPDPERKIDLDHIDRNRLNNRKDNLRVCTRSQNQMNSFRKNNTSGVKGVTWHKHQRKWYAYITTDYKSISLGYFKSLAQAAKVRRNAEIKYHGEYALKGV